MTVRRQIISNSDSSSATVRRWWMAHRRRWMAHQQRFNGLATMNGSLATVQWRQQRYFFCLGFSFFFYGEWLNVFCFAEWLNVFFFFFFSFWGVFRVVVSDELFLSLLPTSSDEFLFCHKVVFSDEIISLLLLTSSEEFLFRHKRTQNLFHF